MKVLVACEESQVICSEFRKLGIECYSNDIIPTSGSHPEWHLQYDIFEAIAAQKWDLLVAHPPCTYLSSCGNGWFNEEKYGDKARLRKHLRLEALEFVKKIWDCGIPHIAIENPIGFLSNNFRKPDQIIQPYYFGTGASDQHLKATCLWLKGLSPLTYDETLPKPAPLAVGIRRPSKWHKGGELKNRYFTHQKKTAKDRSKTFPGIARAIALQWSDYLNKQKSNDGDQV